MSKFDLQIFKTVQFPRVRLQMSHLPAILSQILWIVSTSVVATASVIRVHSSSKLAARGGTESLSVMYLHTEQSRGVKSGDRGGQAIVPPRPIQANICRVTRGNTLNSCEYLPIKLTYTAFCDIYCNISFLFSVCNYNLVLHNHFWNALYINRTAVSNACRGFLTAAGVPSHWPSQ